MTTATPALTPAQLHVLYLFARKQSISDIAKSAGLPMDMVSATVTELAGFDRGRAGELTRGFQPPPPVVRAPVFQPPTDAPARDASAPTVTVVSAKTATAPPSNLAAILAAAEAHPLTRIRTIAVKVRTQLDVLRARLEDDERARLTREADARADEAARALVQTLARQLAEARAALRPAAKVHLKTTVAADSEAQRVRRWAVENDVVISPLGKIPNAALAAYRAAHPTGEG